jgi:hypothetical protein
MAQVNMSVNKLIAHMPEVILEVRKAADEVGLKAEALFASHDRPGGHHIEVTHEKVDSLISLVGPAPLSVEYGHTASNGTHVEGLHILSRAADL